MRLMLLQVLVLPALVVAAPAQEGSIPKRQAAFLKALQQEKVKEAFEDLLEGSLILDKKQDVENLVTQTEKGIAIYGGVTSIEDLGIVRQDKHLATGLAIVCCEKAPLYFYFIWYRNKADAPWRLHNVWFDDNSKYFMEHRR